MTIEGILDAADHATPGPWKCVGDGIFPENSLFSIARICNAHSAVAGVEAANGALMCGAHTLAAEVRRLRGRERVLVGALGEIASVPTDNFSGLQAFIHWVRNRAGAALEAVKE